MPRATLAATAVGLAAVLLLAGCDPDAPEPSPAASESTTPGPSPSASPSASPSPTSTVAPPERPAEMDDDGPAGAEAAVVYFMQLDGYMMSTGDTSEWERISHKSCDFCADRLEQAREIAEHEIVWSGGEVAAKVTHTYEQDAATGAWFVDVDASVTSTSAIDSTGAEILSEESAQKEYRVKVARKSDSWTILAIGDRPE